MLIFVYRFNPPVIVDSEVKCPCLLYVCDTDTVHDLVGLYTEDESDLPAIPPSSSGMPSSTEPTSTPPKTTTTSSETTSSDSRTPLTTSDDPTTRTSSTEPFLTDSGSNSQATGTAVAMCAVFGLLFTIGLITLYKVKECL